MYVYMCACMYKDAEFNRRTLISIEIFNVKKLFSVLKKRSYNIVYSKLMNPNRTKFIKKAYN